MNSLQDFQARVREAAARRSPLQICGQGSKAFYGEAAEGERLDTCGFSGVSSYEPSELVVTVKAGTPLVELEALLASQGQGLAFEPPRFGLSQGRGGTVGGMVATGLSGPARPSQGGVREHVLGLTLLNGRGELLNFGGTVIKNVAGYDVSRLMVGAMGVLGLILEVSLKVLPRPVAERTLRFEMAPDKALAQLQRWAGQPWPISASACWEGALVLRLSGAEAAVQAACQQLGGERIPDDQATPFWQGLRDHRDEFFLGAERAVQGGAHLWRLSLPPTAPFTALPGEQLIEWGGAQRWLVAPQGCGSLRELAQELGGHATLFRAEDKSCGVFTPPSEPLMRIHRDLKAAFDPDRLFNPGRLYPDL